MDNFEKFVWKQKNIKRNYRVKYIFDVWYKKQSASLTFNKLHSNIDSHTENILVHQDFMQTFLPASYALCFLSLHPDYDKAEVA